MNWIDVLGSIPAAKANLSNPSRSLGFSSTWLRGQDLNL
jgi:hypothetical protein